MRLNEFDGNEHEPVGCSFSTAPQHGRKYWHLMDVISHHKFFDNHAKRISELKLFVLSSDRVTVTITRIEALE
ncbi:hypothetical protein HPP92_024382 [Vanilla planifolia]|uniref:Uncharacterized protein n=1 Tax=Vanilla planifolia TaxID=51239 RepID=A0A835PJK0_VANPL|nr:hypothetical protein HPP92_024382 [Vanilla planifolia]